MKKKKVKKKIFFTNVKKKTKKKIFFFTKKKKKTKKCITIPTGTIKSKLKL